MSKKYAGLSGALRELLYRENIKPIELARKLNIPQPTIHRLVTGKSTRPHRSSLEPIAKFFSIPIEQLTGEEPLEKVRELSHQAVNVVPVLLWDELPCVKKNNGASSIALMGHTNADCFAVIMNDHSMEPLFDKDSILVFDPKKLPTDRAFVLVKLYETQQIIFRQLLIDAAHQYLKPLSPDFHAFGMRLLDDRDKILASLIESRKSYHV